MNMRLDDPLLVIEVPLILAAVDEAVPVRSSSLPEVRVDDPVTDDAVDSSESPEKLSEGIFEASLG